MRLGRYNEIIMRQILAFVICLCFLFIGRSALADVPVYAPMNSAVVSPQTTENAAAPNATASIVPADGTIPTPTTSGQQPASSVAPTDAVNATPSATDQTAPVAPTDATEVAPAESDDQPSSPSPSIMDAIVRGKELLAPVLADFQNKEKGIAPLLSKTGQTAAALAVWDKSADTVTVYGGTRGAKFFTADDSGPVVPIVSSAGSQTAYRSSDPNLVVVGTVQASMTAVTVKRKKRYSPVFSYYVPYVKELYSPETLAAGSDYLSSLIKDAFDDLDAKGVMSRAFPDQALTAVVDPYLIKSIAVIENADSQIFDDNNSEDSLGRFLVKLAINKENALGTVVSSAGARGMVQFIPSTYKIMVTKRTDLGLIPDFAQGMADHKNAIKAEAAYLDMILADLPDSVKDLYEQDRGAAAEYLAAGYNGGSVRVRKAIQAWGADWSAAHASYAELTAKTKSLNARIAQIDRKLAAGGLSKQKIIDLKAERKTDVMNRETTIALRNKTNGSCLKPETVAYVVKLRRVYDMLAAGFFATPSAPTNTVPTVAATSSITTAANVD
jgi:Transglycosylase SLT domain